MPKAYVWSSSLSPINPAKRAVATEPPPKRGSMVFFLRLRFLHPTETEFNKTADLYRFKIALPLRHFPMDLRVPAGQVCPILRGRCRKRPARLSFSRSFHLSAGLFCLLFVYKKQFDVMACIVSYQ
jgi:hypothetical protein